MKETVQLAADLLDNRDVSQKKEEQRSDAEILEAVRFHAENKILNTSTPGKIRGPEALTDANAVDVLQQVHYLLQNGQNVCVYGQGSQMYCLRNYVVRQMRDDHLIFEMLGFLKKGVFRNMVTSFLSQAMDNKDLELQPKLKKDYRTEIVKNKKPKIKSCFKYLGNVLGEMNRQFDCNVLFVVYKLEQVLERERGFLEDLQELVEKQKVKLLFTIENFQTFWKNVAPTTLNKLMVNFLPVHTFETQTFELESLSLTFNVNSSMKNFYSFLAIFSSFNDTMKEFLFFILLLFANEKKREFRTDYLYTQLSNEMIVNSRNLFNLYLKEPLDHHILEAKSNVIRHFYTTGTLNRIIRKVQKLEPKIAERHSGLIASLVLDNSDSEPELEDEKKTTRRKAKKRRGESDEESEEEEASAEEQDEDEEENFQADSEGSSANDENDLWP